jgi:hypothetical protein
MSQIVPNFIWWLFVITQHPSLARKTSKPLAAIKFGFFVGNFDIRSQLLVTIL